jgi:hypothetical protein
MKYAVLSLAVLAGTPANAETMFCNPKCMYTTETIDKALASRAAREPDVYWTADEPVADTAWVYNERYMNKRRNQCQIETHTKATNGSDSTLTVAVLSKGSLVLVIRDSDWQRRIKTDFEWKVGQQYQNVMIHQGQLMTSGRAISDEEFWIALPKQQEIWLRAFFTEEGRILINVGGLTVKSWVAPGLSKGWERLKRCQLL